MVPYKEWGLRVVDPGRSTRSRVPGPCPGETATDPSRRPRWTWAAGFLPLAAQQAKILAAGDLGPGFWPAEGLKAVLAGWDRLLGAWSWSARQGALDLGVGSRTLELGAGSRGLGSGSFPLASRVWG
jgi:hypothetical protein